MRCNELSRVLFAHLIFLTSVWFLLLFLRLRTPTITGDELVYSANLGTEQLNDQRTKEAQNVIDSSEAFPFALERSTVEVRILASDRGRGYLTQVVGFLLKHFEGKALPSLRICNVEGKQFSALEQFNGKIPIINMTGPSVSRSELAQMIVKETADYWKCLAEPTLSRYVLLLEDDSLVVPHFPRLLSSLTRQLDLRHNIDYVKLYHPNYLRKLPSVPLAITCSIFFVMIFQFAFFRRIHLLFFVISAVIIYVIFRSFTYQFMADLRYSFTGSAYISMPESCCTPAVIFRSATKDTMARELLQVESYPGRAKDHILDESRFVGRMSDTNWVVHIGAFSSVRNREVRLSEKYSVLQLNEGHSWFRYFL